MALKWLPLRKPLWPEKVTILGVVDICRGSDGFETGVEQTGFLSLGQGEFYTGDFAINQRDYK